MRRSSTRGQLYLLSGEPGIGKTRVCDRVARLAEACGMLTSWGRCWEAGGARAYFPYVLRATEQSLSVFAFEDAVQLLDRACAALEYWVVRHAGHCFRLRDSLGLRYLARLIAEPGRPLHVLELSGAGGAVGVLAGDSGELLDERARRVPPAPR